MWMARVRSMSVKSPKDSYIERIYDFGNDRKLRDKYLSSFGYIRMGKILEDLDGVAGAIAYK